MDTSNARVALAVLAGYALGRTKKGRAAIKLMMWASGSQGFLARTVSEVVRSEETTKLLAQVQGTVLESVQQAALDAATARMNQLSDVLATRTEALMAAEDVTAGIGDEAGKGASNASKSLSGASGASKPVSGGACYEVSASGGKPGTAPRRGAE